MLQRYTYTGAPSEPAGDDTSELFRLDSSVDLSPLASMPGVISLSGDMAWPWMAKVMALLRTSIQS